MKRPKRFSKRSRRAALGLAIAALLSAGSLLGVHWRVSTAGNGRIYEHVENVPAAPVAIVLGAYVRPDGTLSDSLKDRLTCARDLFQAGTVEKILVSGDHNAPEYDEVHAMRGWLLEQNIPSEVVFMDHAGLRTLDTMVRAAEVFGVEKAIICTQRYHQARSIYLADAAGIEAVGLVADKGIYRKHRQYARREALARILAWADINLLNTRPTHLGTFISIKGPASATHDANTQTH